MAYWTDIKCTVSNCWWRILSPKTRAGLMLMLCTRYTVRISHVLIRRTYFKNVFQERISRTHRQLTEYKVFGWVWYLMHVFKCAPHMQYNISASYVPFKPNISNSWHMTYTELENTHLTIVWMSQTHYIYAALISLVLLNRNVSDKWGNKHVYIHDTNVHATDMTYK